MHHILNAVLISSFLCLVSVSYIYAPVSTPVPATPPENVKCSICDMVTIIIENHLIHNTSRIDILTALASLCIYMPREAKKDCADIVTIYAVDILNSIERYSPYSVCHLYDLCPKEEHNTLDRYHSKQCLICVFLTSIENQRKKDTRYNTVIHDPLCHVLPPIYHDRCVSMANSFYDRFMYLLNKNILPDKVCHLYGLCRNPSYIDPRKGDNISHEDL